MTSRFDKDDTTYRQANGYEAKQRTHRVMYVNDLPREGNQVGDIGIVKPPDVTMLMYAWNGIAWALASLDQVVDATRADRVRAKKIMTVNESRAEAGLDPIVLHGDMLIDWPF